MCRGTFPEKKLHVPALDLQFFQTLLWPEANLRQAASLHVAQLCFHNAAELGGRGFRLHIEYTVNLPFYPNDHSRVQF